VLASYRPKDHGTGAAEAVQDKEKKLTTEVKIYTPSLADLCACQALRMPVFQRPYGWAPEKAVEYFRDFLSNRHANNLFGSVFGYCQVPWNKVAPTTNELYVTDGQHRLVTSTLAAVALLAEREQRLVHPANGEALSDDALDALEELRSNPDQVAAIERIASAKIHFMVDEDGNTDFVSEFLAKTDAQVERLRVDIERSHAMLAQEKAKQGASRRIPQNFNRLQRKQQEQALTESETSELQRVTAIVEEIRAQRAAMTELNRQTANEVSRLEADVAKASAVPLYAAYVGVKSFLADSSTSALRRFLAQFADRQVTFGIALLVLEPRGNNDVSNIVLDDEAAEIFAQINGQTRPLTPAELLNSLFRSFSGFQVTRPGDIADKLKRSDIFAFDGDRVVDYLARYESENGNTRTSQWVRQLLANVRSIGGATAANSQKAVVAGLKALESFEAFLLDTTNSALAGYVHLYKALARVTHVSSVWVMVARVWESAQADQHPLAKTLAVKDLFKIALLVRLASMNNRSTINLTRDLANKRSLKEVFLYIASGLGYKQRDVVARDEITPGLIAYVKQAIRDIVTTSQFGANQNRNLARVLLATADFNSLGVQVSYQQLFQFEFEHVLPQALQNLEIDIPDNAEGTVALQAQEAIERMLELDDSERTDVINRLGNGALLDKGPNSSLGNVSPFEKLQLIDQKGMHNAYWPSHLQALRDSKGVVGKEYIEARSALFAQQIADFLLGMDFLASALSTTASYA